MLPKNDVTHLKYFYIYTSVADFVLSVPFFCVEWHNLFGNIPSSYVSLCVRISSTSTWEKRFFEWPPLC